MADPARSLRSPLHDRHESLGAKLADFGGWEMPIEYPADGGVLREHAAVRESVGLFDVSHLGKASVRGPGARAFVDRCLTNDLARIGPGRSQYTLCCDPSGGVVDDLIAYLVSDDEVFLVPNALNNGEVVARLAAEAPADVEVVDRHRDFGVLAVQGPRSAEVLERLGLPPQQDYMAWQDANWRDGATVRVCRTGYTGEHGYELLPSAADAPALWDAALAAVRDCGGLPVGLGARDTLRTEMGYPLHGQDMSRSISPLQARAGWAVGWQKDEFWGHHALRVEKTRGAARMLRGLESLGRSIPRAHMSVLARDGSVVGEVTSGTFSPTRRVGIALALISTDANVVPGAELTLDVRGRHSPARVVTPPFVASHVK